MLNLRKYLYTNYPKQFGYYVQYKEILFFVFKINLYKYSNKIYFSTKNQDRWIIEDVFKQKTNGYFIDLAATSGIIDNNTFVLEKKYNWRGICIEPNKKFFSKLKKNRTAICLNECIDYKENTVEFINDGGLSGILADDTDNNYLKRSKKIEKFRKKNLLENKLTRSLVSILDEHNAPHTIDYLSLDIEGSEERALINFDFEKYKFLSLTIERPTLKLHELLVSNGYVFIKHFKVDSFYLHNSIEKNIALTKDKYQELPKKKW